MDRHSMSPDDDDMDMIDAYLDHLHDRGCSPDTIKLRRKILTKLHRDLPFGIARSCGAELEDWLQAHRSANTLATYWVGIRSAYRFWTVDKPPWLAIDPTEHMTPRTFP